MSCAADCNSGACMISCKGQKYQPGMKTLRPTPKMISFLSTAVHTPHEVGGLIEPNFELGTLEVKMSTGGDQDSVEIPLGVYQFHTHPNACRSKESCYFEFPSENDMALIARDGMRGVVAHFVVTLEQVYRVSLSSRLRLQYARNPEKIDLVFDHFAEVMLRLQARAQREGIHIMAQLRKEWAREAHRYGFVVESYASPAEVVERIQAV